MTNDYLDEDEDANMISITKSLKLYERPNKLSAHYHSTIKSEDKLEISNSNKSLKMNCPLMSSCSPYNQREEGINNTYTAIKVPTISDNF
jgi:hypothetical protein